jgi:hypothetical protein
MFLHQGRALRLAGRTLIVQFLTLLREAIRPCVLPHLNLAFDL